MKVLIAEDDPLGSKLLKALLLKWGYDTVAVSNGCEAWRILQQEHGPQMVILDWVLPGMDGVEICRRLRESEKGGDGYTYVVMLTCRDRGEDIVTGMGAGADEYIVKPFDQKVLQARLNTGRRIVESHATLRVANQKLLFMSCLDLLTGARSRNAILDDLDLECYRARREKKPLSVVMVDIDQFKQVNERYGRSIGDQVLRDCVRRINVCVRRTDPFGRLGGDRFLIVLPGVDSETGKIVCRRISKAIGEQEFALDDQTLPVTVSQSLAVWDMQASIEALVGMTEETLQATRSADGSGLAKGDSAS